MLYAQNGRIGTGSLITLGALLIIFLAIVGIVFVFPEELGKVAIRVTIASGDALMRS